jgi:hypothetical protein
MKHQSRRPACSRRETISSRAELEGAQTSTCALGPTAFPTRTGGRVSRSPKVPRSQPASLLNTSSLHGSQMPQPDYKTLPNNAGNRQSSLNNLVRTSIPHNVSNQNMEMHRQIGMQGQLQASNKRSSHSKCGVNRNLGSAVPASQGAALPQSRQTSSVPYSGMGAAGARLISPLECAGAACKMMLSRPRMVLVFPVPGGPYTTTQGHLICRICDSF